MEGWFGGPLLLPGGRLARHRVTGERLQLWRTSWKLGMAAKRDNLSITENSPGEHNGFPKGHWYCTSVCESSLAEAVCPSSTPILIEKSTSVCPYQCSTGRCNCSSRAPLNCISNLFENSYLGSSMLRQKIHWTTPSALQVGGKCSVQKAKAGCFQRGCSWKRAVTGQQIPVDVADRQILLAPGLLSFSPSPSSWTCATIGTHRNVLWLRGGNVVMSYWCQAAVLFTLHTADICRHQGLRGT